MAYSTSDLYKEAINKESRITFIDGELVTTKGDTVAINNKAIDAGSFYITNQCVNSDAFAYGSVFSAEAGITLKTDIDRYSLYDAKIKLFFNLLLSNNEYEKIPLGVFYVNEPNRIGRNITIKAYDGMINLEKELDESTTGTAYELLLFVSERCGIELAQTQEEIAAFVNSDIMLSVVIDRIDTYRDLVSYVAQTLCGFAIFNREGKLKICEYGTESVKTIEAKYRTSSKFSDFETYFSGTTAAFINESKYEAYTHVEEGDGLLYDAGEIPVVQGLDENNQLVIDNMFTKLANVRYVPCDVKFNGDPSLDLGDLVINVDRFGNQIPSLITFYKWSYRGGHQIKSAGSNPKLSSVKEKKNKDLANLQAEVNAKTVGVYSYTNVSPYSIKGGEDASDMVEIIRIAFAVNEEVTALFMATVSFDMDVDGFVQFDSYLDAVYYKNSTIYQYCHKGRNIITFINYIPCKKNTVYNFSVFAKTYYEETNLRVNNAKIATNENARNAIITAYESLVESLKTAVSVPIETLEDTITYDIVEPTTTIPTMKISTYDIKAAIFGQGLAGKVAWDGTITMFESFDKVKFDEAHCVNFIDGLSVGLVDDNVNAFTAIFDKLDVTSLPIIGFNDLLGVNEVVINYLFNTSKKALYTYDNSYVKADDKFMLNTEYTFESTEKEIDVGHMSVVTLDTSTFESVQSIEVEVV